MLGAVEVMGRKGRGADRASIGALGAYALAVAVIIAAPIVRRVYMPPTPPPDLPRPALGSRASRSLSVEELVAAPPFKTSQRQRSAHVSRTWDIIGGVGVNTVSVNPKAENVQIVLGLAKGTVLSEGKFGRESFGEMVRRFRPRVAINGTYFNLKTNEPVGSLVMEGRLIYDGLCSSTLFINEQGDVWIAYHQGKFGRNVGWARDIRTAVCAGPSLLMGGKLALRPYDEGFSDPSLFAIARRSAVGVTSDGKLLLVTVHTPITLNKLAHIMLRLGAVDATNLDGGSSSALYSNGQYVTLPERELTNLILVYD